MPEQLLIGFNPSSAMNRVLNARRMIPRRVIWLIISVIVCGFLWIWLRRGLSPLFAAIFFGIGIAYSVISLILAIVAWNNAKDIYASITPGVAVAVDRNGCWLQGIGMAWPEISRIHITPGRFGRLASLDITRLDGMVSSIPLPDLDVMPGTIDAAIRSYSGGKQHIDISKLGN